MTIKYDKRDDAMIKGAHIATEKRIALQIEKYAEINVIEDERVTTWRPTEQGTEMFGPGGALHGKISKAEALCL